MTITKSELLHHITRHPGQTKAELAETLSSPGFHITLFHIAGLLRDLLTEGEIVRVTDGQRRQTYRPALQGSAA